MTAIHDVRAVLLDIEGTTSSLSFVRDTLFPHARRRLPAYVSEHAGQIGAILDEVRREAGDPALPLAGITQQLLTWMDEDRKITPLKTLQGLIWKAGYESGELQGHLYEDAFEALTAWHALRLKLYIYSSGSVAAQQLLFAHTRHGDLRPLLSGYFDTRTGSKLEPASYAAIAREVGLPAGSILFLSDHPGEVRAATAAGLKAVRVDRDAPAASGGTGEPVAHLFSDLALDTGDTHA
jgi:enolase-phosphatase E1